MGEDSFGVVCNIFFVLALKIAALPRLYEELIQLHGRPTVLSKRKIFDFGLESEPASKALSGETLQVPEHCYIEFH